MDSKQEILYYLKSIEIASSAMKAMLAYSLDKDDWNTMAEFSTVLSMASETIHDICDNHTD
jgi:hypothetical protein